MFWVAYSLESTTKISSTGSAGQVEQSRALRTAVAIPSHSRPQITHHPISTWVTVQPNCAIPGRAWWLWCQFSPCKPCHRASQGTLRLESSPDQVNE